MEDPSWVRGDEYGGSERREDFRLRTGPTLDGWAASERSERSAMSHTSMCSGSSLSCGIQANWSNMDPLPGNGVGRSNREERRRRVVREAAGCVLRFLLEGAQLEDTLEYWIQNQRERVAWRYGKLTYDEVSVRWIGDKSRGGLARPADAIRLGDVRKVAFRARWRHVREGDQSGRGAGAAIDTVRANGRVFERQDEALEKQSQSWHRLY